MTSDTACLIVSSGASTFTPLCWSPRTARNGLFGLITAPSASSGIFQKLTFGISKPNVSPPINGTQSGISHDSVLIASITKLIADSTALIMPLMPPITVLITPLIISQIPSQISVKPLPRPSSKPKALRISSTMSPIPLMISVSASGSFVTSPTRS